MILLEEGERMMFIGSPRLKSLKEMKEINMYLADIPLYDVTREIVLLYEQRNAEIGITSVSGFFPPRAHYIICAYTHFYFIFCWGGG